MRKCGACQLCCIIPAIPELGKPANTRCVHLTPHGCGIYDSPERPEVCRGFACGWLESRYGDESLRPDHVGAYVTDLAPGDGLQDQNGAVIRALADQPRRFRKYAGMVRFIGQVVAGGGDVLVVAGDSRRVLTRNEQFLALAVQDPDGRPVNVEMVR